MDTNKDREYHFPYTPYSIQKSLMDSVYNTIEEGSIGLFESPTGTGKTLSLLCGALCWLDQASKLPDDFEREKKGDDSKAENMSKLPLWLQQQSSENAELREKRESLQFQMRIIEEKLNQHQNNKRSLVTKREISTKRGDTPGKRQKEDSDSDEYAVSDSEESLGYKYNKMEENEAIATTKIYYCSRTHSQLKQVMEELKKTEWDKKIRCCILSGRKMMCINEEVNKLTTDYGMTEKCLYLQRNKGCEFKKKERMEYLGNEILLKNHDIEDIVKMSEECKACPYYSARQVIPFLDLVLLPYNYILNENSRKALNIDLHNQVVLFDEAHNLVNTLSEIYSPKVTIVMLTSSLSCLESYRQHYQYRLSSSSHSVLIHLSTLIKAFISLLKGNSSHVKDVEALNTDDFLRQLHIDNINAFQIIRFLAEKRMVYKLSGFSDRFSDEHSMFYPAVLDFISLLMTDNRDCRILVSQRPTESNTPFIQFVLLNPGVQFKAILRECRSLIIAGGTLQPFEDIQYQLLGASKRITTLALGHILPVSHIRCFTIVQTDQNLPITFSYQNRDCQEQWIAVMRLLYRLSQVVPKGVVVFFASFSALQTAIQCLESSHFKERIEEKKRVFYEERGVSSTFQAYSDYITRNADMGAMLFAVIGGKLSEGINFSDDLGRSVVIIGLPYPNVNDPILQEKMKYYTQSSSALSSSEIYQNMCIKAVNQAIGRAFRHREDYASVLLVDSRYDQPSVRKKITSWVIKENKVISNPEDMFVALSLFYQSMSETAA